MEGPIFSFIVKGNLKENNIKLRLCQNDFKYGLWQICLRSLVIKSFEKIDLPIGIKINFVNDIQFNSYNEIEKYNPTTNILHLKCEVNETLSFTFNDLWYLINSLNETLQINFSNIFSNEIIKTNADIAVHVIMRKIR